MSAPDIFLSYNREDAEVARRFADAFKAAGLEVWWDQALRSGEAYDEVTEAALRGAKAVVVLWSLRSVVSRWVRAEATVGDRNRTLVPARIEACELPIMFELTQTADLSHWQGEADDPSWEAFLADVRKFVSEGASAVTAVTPPKPGPKARQTSSRPSIAVLPFINRSGIGEDDVFADCMAEDITAALTTSPRTKVISASATAKYGNGARNLQDIGRELGARYLLEGNVRRVGRNLRVTAQVVEAETSNILWNRKFDRPLDEFAALQEELATEVAAHLGVELQIVEMDQSLKERKSMTAWKAVLRSDAYTAQMTQSGGEAAVVEARRAIEIDPGFGPAYATLACTLAPMLLYGCEDEDELKQEVLANVAAARKLAPNNPLVLLRIATALSHIGRAQEALPLAQRAVDINANLEAAHMALANALLHLGRWDDAIEECEVVARLAPKGFWLAYTLGLRAEAHLGAGRFETALEFSNQYLPYQNIVYEHLVRIICLAKLKRKGEARDALCRLRDAEPEISFADLEMFVRRSAVGSDRNRAEDMLSTLRPFWEETEPAA